MFNWNREAQTDAPSRSDLNWQSALRLGLFISVALLFSTVTPPEILAATLSSLLTMAAVASVLIGVFMADEVFADHSTRWDEAAVLLFLGVAVGTFGSPGAIATATAMAS